MLQAFILRYVSIEGGGGGVRWVAISWFLHGLVVD